MRSQCPFWAPSVLFTAVAILLAGCNGSQAPRPLGDTSDQANGHDPDDVPITEADMKMPASYADAIPLIKSYRDAIRTNVEAGTPTKAHRSLDELDIVLNNLTTLGRDSGVAKAQWETVNTTARELRDLFNQVHSAIDEKRAPDYASVSIPIDAAIERLAGIVPTAGS